MKVVIIGGGIAAVKTAMGLRGIENCQVELISDSPEVHSYSSLSQELYHRAPNLRELSISDIFADDKNIDVVIDSVVAINNQVKAVKGSSGNIYRYDTLILASGFGDGSPKYSVPGVEQFAYSVYSKKSLSELKIKLSSLIDDKSRKKIRVIVVGGGLSGVEFASNISNFAKTNFADKIENKTIEVELIELANKVLPKYNDEISGKVLKRLNSLGVRIYLHSKVKQISDHTVKLTNDERVADLIVWAGNINQNTLLSRYENLLKQKDGKILVDKFMSVVDAPEILVIGDAAATPYSGVIQTAIYDAEYASELIKSRINKKSPKEYVPRQPEIVATLGKGWSLYISKKKAHSGKKGWRRRHKAENKINKRLRSLA